jgi:membrane-associated phospholipid phosphatase
MSRPLHEPSSRNRRLFARGAFLALVFAGSSAAAQDAIARPGGDETVTPRVALRHDLAADLAVTGGVFAAWVGWRLVRPDVLPTSCRLCDGDGPDDVNAVDRAFRSALRRPDPQPAITASHVMSGAAPLTAVGLGAAASAADGRLDEAPLNTLLLAEATVIAVAVNEVLKSTLGRARPRVHALDEDERREALGEDSALVSMPSLHTASAFALAASSGAIATMRGYRLAPLVWLGTGLLAFATGYFRMAADEHYFTDVLAGAGVGVSVGLAVPLLFHGPLRLPRTAATRWLEGASLGSSEVRGGHVAHLRWGF